MTRYRQKLKKRIILELQENGPQLVWELCKKLEKEPRVVVNYLRHFSDFEVKCKRGCLNVWGLRVKSEEETT